MNTRILKGAVAAAISFSVIAGASAQAQTITGAGASFPALLYQKWAQAYRQQTGKAVNYQSIGSSGGIKNILARAVDFGATDGPMTASDMMKAPSIVHIPTVAGAVAVAYNAPGVPKGLKLTGPVIADIYLGKITTWNDSDIASLNPGVSLPNRKIVPVFRSDGSGTTRIFTNYLTQVSPSFKATVGTANSVRFPAGIGGKGNEGVAALVKQTPGALGYMEFAYAEKNNVPYAAVRNAAGNWILPSIKATTVAAEGAKMPSNFRFVMTNTPAAQGYPIAGFTWILVHQDTKPEVKQFLQWALTKGQDMAEPNDYAPLPDNLRDRALAVVNSLK